MCCSSWLRDFEAVTVKMAREQGLALNPSRLAGMCGRLKCCLRYEYATYVEVERNLPPDGSTFNLVKGDGKVVRQNILKQTVLIQGEKDGGVVEATLEDLVESARGITLYIYRMDFPAQTSPQLSSPAPRLTQAQAGGRRASVCDSQIPGGLRPCRFQASQTLRAMTISVRWLNASTSRPRSSTATARRTSATPGVPGHRHLLRHQRRKGRKRHVRYRHRRTRPEEFPRRRGRGTQPKAFADKISDRSSGACAELEHQLRLFRPHHRPGPSRSSCSACSPARSRIGDIVFQEYEGSTASAASASIRKRNSSKMNCPAHQRPVE